MSAQDPAWAPARIIKGIIPWRLNRKNFYVSGLTWEKFRARRPWLSFDEFWSDRERVYDYWNSSAIPKNTQKFCLSTGFAVK